MTTAITITKKCHRCKKPVPLTDFYLRSSYRGKIDTPTEPKHVISECKDCMKNRSKTGTRLSPHETRTQSEALFIQYLTSRGIPALPGKAVHYADVDVVALGHIWIEVKYSTLAYSHNAERFRFGFTPKQANRGPQGHIIALICDWGDGDITYHLFPHNHKVFFNEHGKMKTGINFVPGQLEAVKHKRRHILTQPIMDNAQDNTRLINIYLNRIRTALLDKQTLAYDVPFARDYVAQVKTEAA